MQEDGLQTLIETLPLELQIKVYNYALSLKKTIQSEEVHLFSTCMKVQLKCLMILTHLYQTLSGWVICELAV